MAVDVQVMGWVTSLSDLLSYHHESPAADLRDRGITKSFACFVHARTLDMSSDVNEYCLRHDENKATEKLHHNHRSTTPKESGMGGTNRILHSVA